MTKIINLTPHPINLLDENNNTIRTFASDGLVRLKANTVDAGYQIDGCKITTTQFGEVDGLKDVEYDTSVCPTLQANGYGYYAEAECSLCTHHAGSGKCNAANPAVYYIVSQLVKTALSNRPDLLVPAEVVRDANGNIVGCKSFGI